MYFANLFLWIASSSCKFDNCKKLPKPITSLRFNFVNCCFNWLMYGIISSWNTIRAIILSSLFAMNGRLSSRLCIRSVLINSSSFLASGYSLFNRSKTSVLKCKYCVQCVPKSPIGVLGTHWSTQYFALQDRVLSDWKISDMLKMTGINTLRMHNLRDSLPFITNNLTTILSLVYLFLVMVPYINQLKQQFTKLANARKMISALVVFTVIRHMMMCNSKTRILQNTSKLANSFRFRINYPLAF